MTSEGNQILGRIYKIVSSETDQVYIGSTVLTLKQRLALHKSKYNKYLAGLYHYISSFEIVKFVDCDIELLYEDIFDNRKHLCRIEGDYIRQNENTINMRVAGRSKKEYAENNADHIKQHKKEYYEKHKDSIKENNKRYIEQNKEKVSLRKKNYEAKDPERWRQYNKEYRNLHRDQIHEKKKQYALSNKAHIQEQKHKYYEAHKEKAATYNKEYRERNRDKLRESGREVIECLICKACFQKQEKARHEKSLKHRSALSQSSSSELSAMENLTSD